MPTHAVLDRPAGSRWMATITKAVTCLVAASLSLAEDAGRLNGKAVDEEGQALPGLTIRLVSIEADSVRLPPVETDKQGRFVVPSFPPGMRRLELDDPGLAIRHITLDVREASGSRLGRLDEELPAGVLPPPFAIGPLQRAKLELVIGRVEAGAARGGSTEFARAREESDSLRRLNELLESGEAERLLAESERVIEKEPESGGAHYLRAIALWRLGRLEEAASGMRRASALVPEQPGIRGATGSVLLERADELHQDGRAEAASAVVNEAESLLREECEQGLASVTFLTNWVIALERSGHPADALEPLAQLIELAPDNRTARLRRAELLIDAGRLDEALDVLPAPDADVATVLYNGAVGLFDVGEIDASRRLLDRAIAIDGAPPQVHQLLGRLLLQQGDNQGALAALEKFIELAPDDPTAGTDRELIKALEP